jgi:nascent polypeptide-associated complex subunit beta
MNVQEARARMKARMGGQSSRTGGRGSVRRKKKAVHKTTSTDEKRLQGTLKRLNVNNIPAIEEVNLFKDNGTVIHFQAPKVQASIAANTYVISGQCETKSLQELLPGIINQLGPDSLQNLKKIAEQYSGNGGEGGGDDDDDDDDDIPDLVENFDDAADN